MHCLSSVYFVTQPLHVSGICVAHHQQVYRIYIQELVKASWNVMAHAQKSDFVFRRNGRVHLNRPGASVHSTTGSRGVRISGSNAGYTMFWGSVKRTGYPLHSPVSPSLPFRCVTVCHHISTEVYTVIIQQLVRIVLFTWLLSELEWTTDCQLKSTALTSCCIYTVYLLMMGYKYARNM